MAKDSANGRKPKRRKKTAAGGTSAKSARSEKKVSGTASHRRARRTAGTATKRGGPKRKVAADTKRDALDGVTVETLKTLQVPTHIWQAWSGKSAGELQALHHRFGAPLYGSPIDVPAAVHWYTRRVAEYNKRHKGGGRLDGSAGGDEGDADPNMVGPLSPALEKYREERARIARLTRLQMEKSLVSVEAMSAVLGKWAERLVKAQDELEREHGPPAAGVLRTALTDCRRMVEELGAVMKAEGEMGKAE